MQIEDVSISSMNESELLSVKRARLEECLDLLYSIERKIKMRRTFSRYALFIFINREKFRSRLCQLMDEQARLEDEYDVLSSEIAELEAKIRGEKA